METRNKKEDLRRKGATNWVLAKKGKKTLFIYMQREYSYAKEKKKVKDKVNDSSGQKGWTLRRTGKPTEEINLILGIHPLKTTGLQE